MKVAPKDDYFATDNYISAYPKLDPNHHRSGPYDKALLDEMTPERVHTVLAEGLDLTCEEARQGIWDEMDGRAEAMVELDRDYAPGLNNYDDIYNQLQADFLPRGVTGMGNQTRLKEMFVESEWMIEEVLGKSRIENK